MSALDALLASCDRRWRDVPGYEGVYAVSDDGYVVSLERTCNARHGQRKVRTRLLSQTRQMKRGALRSVRVKLSAEGEKALTVTVGKLVLMAFAGVRTESVAHYLDGNPANNRLSNLEWSDFKTIALDAPRGGYGDLRRDNGKFASRT